MPPLPSRVPVGSSLDSAARQRMQIHGIKEMPAGYDAEVAELFRDLRSASSLSESDLAARLSTRVEVVQALEQGALYALPPWAETCRVVNGYGAMLNLDVRPLLRRIYAQLEAGIVELGPKPIPEVPVMAPPVPNGLAQNPFAPAKFEPKYDTNSFEANRLQGNSFESGKRAVPKPSAQTPDWPENPFAQPKPAQPQAAPKPPQTQWPQAQPAPSPQQNSWPTGPSSPFQTNWPNAAPQTQPKPAAQSARPNVPKPQPPQQPQAPWSANAPAGRPQPLQQPQGQGQPPRPQPQPRPAQAQTPPPPPRPQPQQPKPPSQADLQSAWQQAQPLEPQRRAQPAPPPPAPPLQKEEKPSRKRSLLKWGIVLLLLAIMGVGGYLVLGHLKGPGGFQSSTPANLDPDDPRSHKADKLQGPS
jgi:hypothetical protein